MSAFQQIFLKGFLLFSFLPHRPPRLIRQTGSVSPSPTADLGQMLICFLPHSRLIGPDLEFLCKWSPHCILFCIWLPLLSTALIAHILCAIHSGLLLSVPLHECTMVCGSIHLLGPLTTKNIPFQSLCENTYTFILDKHLEFLSQMTNLYLTL